MIKYWSKLPTWGQWIAGVGAGIAVIYSAALWSAEAIDNAIVTEGELGLVIKQLRIDKNQDKLMELNRDIIAERFANDAEKEFILTEIKEIQKELRCDVENKCEEN